MRLKDLDSFVNEPPIQAKSTKTSVDAPRLGMAFLSFCSRPRSVLPIG